MKKLLLAYLLLTLSLTQAMAGGGASDEPVAMLGHDIIALISDKTTKCVKTKDDSTCSTFFSRDGVVKRILDTNGKRRSGKWYIDEENHLCIRWDGKTKSLVFVVMDMRDSTYNLIKKGKLKSTIIGFSEGNSLNL